MIVRDSDATAIGSEETSAPTLTRVAVNRTARGDTAYVQANATPAFSQMNSTGAHGNRIVKQGGVLNGQTLNGGGLVIEMDGNILANGGPVTFVAGQVIKLRNGAYIQANGTGSLIAISTAAAPIVFTSTRDDTAGGDSNADASASSPAKGDWQGFYFDASSVNSVLRNVDIRYAGNAYTPGHPSGFVPSVQIRSGNATLDGVRIVSGNSTGLRITGSVQPALTNVSITNCDGGAVSTDIAADPVIANLSASGNGVDAYFVDGGTFPANRRLSLTNMPYVPTGNLFVPFGVTLTLDPGVIFKWTNGQYLQVNGTLSAIGTAAKPIIFTSRRDDSVFGDSFQDGSSGAAAPQAGDWQSIYIESNASSVALDQVEIRYAGNAYIPGHTSGFLQAMRVDATSSIQRTRIFASDGIGILLRGSTSTLLDTVTVESARSSAIRWEIAATPIFRGLRAIGSGENAARLTGGTLPANYTWSAGGLPIHVEANFFVPSGLTLTIVPGQVVKFVSNGNYFQVNGSLNADASAGAPIVFTSTRDDTAGGDSNNDGSASSPLRGDWRGVFIESNATPVTLKNVEFRYAGNAYNPGHTSGFEQTIRINATSTLANVRILESDSSGVLLQNPTTTTLTGVSVIGARQSAYVMDIQARPVFSGVTASGTGFDGVVLAAGSLPVSYTWDFNRLPVYLSGNFFVPVGITLTIAAGHTILAGVNGTGNGQYFQVNGTLLTQGTSAAPVIFTSRNDRTPFAASVNTAATASPDSGDWRGVFIEAGSSANLASTEIRYAGNAYNPGHTSGFEQSLRIFSSNVVANGLVVRDSDASGIVIGNGSSFTMTGGRVTRTDARIRGYVAVDVQSGSFTGSGVNFSGGGLGVLVRAGTSATISGSAFSGFSSSAARNDNTNFASFLATGNWWGDAAGPNDASLADGRQNSNPSGQLVTDWVDYGSFLISRPAVSTGLTVVSFSPTLTNSSPAYLTISFSAPPAPGTVSSANITLTGPGGPIALGTVTQISATEFRAALPVGLTAGNYTLSISTGVTTSAGEPLDAAFTGQLVIDQTSPTVTAQTPSGAADSAFSQIIFTFNEPIDPNSFTTSVATLTGPGGAIQVLSITRLSAVQFALGFAQQSVNGNYTVALSTGIRDLAGNALASAYSNTFTLARGALRIISQSPSAPVNTVLSSIDVTFAVAPLASSFTPLQVQIFGPLGSVTGTGVLPLTGTTFRITFPTQYANGTYTFIIGPDITDPAGVAMDQNQDGIPGTTVDRYNGSVTVQNVRPVVLAQSPTGTVGAGLSSLTVTFAAPIRADTFTPDVASLTAPGGGNIAIASVVSVSSTVFRLNFAPLTTGGLYNLSVGPAIYDTFGNGMAAAYTGSFTVDAVPPSITSATPSGTVNTALSSLTVTFNKPVDATTFTPARAQLTGPSGAIAITAVVQLAANSFRLDFARQTASGQYAFTIGPAIQDTVGNAMTAPFNQTVTVALPNLVPSGFTAPGGIAQGGIAQISWTTTNSGDAAAGLFTDQVWLSTTGTLAGATLIGSATTSASLAPGASVPQSISWNVPFSVSGNYTLILLVNGSNSVVENSTADNTATRPITISDSRPPVDLSAGTVTVPSSALTGQSIAIAYQVSNSGTANLTGAAWTDRVYISTSATLDASARLIATIPVAVDLALNAIYTVNATVALPMDLAAGNYRVFVVINAGGEVNENGFTANNTGSSAPMSVALAPVPDLTASGITGPPSGNAGTFATVSWSVQNIGTVASAVGTTTDQVWLSRDGTLNGASLLGTRTYNLNLAAQSSVPQSLQITVPSLTPGTYSFVVVVNSTGAIYERGASANNTVVAASPFTLTVPDIVVSTVSASASAQSGDTISISYTVFNSGNGAASGSVTDRIYVNRNAFVDGTAVLLATRTYNVNLAASDSVVRPESVTLPQGLNGNFYIVVVANATRSVPESNAANNSTASGVIAVALAPYADLTVTNVTAPARVIGDPADFTVSWTVANQGTGTGTQSSWVDRVTISKNPSLGISGDIVLGEVQHTGALPVGVTYTQSHTFSLPSGLEGRFYVFVRTDAAGEVYQFNNTATDIGRTSSTSEVLRRPFADLVVQQVTAPTTGLTGQLVPVSWTVANLGIATTESASVFDDVFVSTDANGGSLRYVTTFERSGVLRANENYRRTVDVRLPSDLSSGTYFVFVRTRAEYEGIFTDNNQGRSAGIGVTFVPPARGDLETTAVTAPSSALDGQAVDVTWSVRNNGPDALTGGWTDTLYLLPAGETNLALATVLGNFTQPVSLGSGNNYSRTVNVILPARIQGVFTIVVVADSGHAADIVGSDNNRLSSGSLTISLRARPLLQVTSATGPTASVTTGTVIDVTWTVANFGNANTPTGGSRWSDSVYLSLTNTLTGGAYLLGSRTNGSALAVGQSYTTTANFTLPRSISGNAFLIIKPDAGGAVDQQPGPGVNYLAIPISIDSVPVPPPDLVLQQVTAPPTVFDGTNFTVRWHVANLGVGPAVPESWTESIWLTNGTDRPNPSRGDLLLSVVSHSGALVVGDSYDASATVRVPSFTRGVFFLTVWTNSSNGVYETQLATNLNPDAPNDIQGNNFKAIPLTVLLQPSADLVVTSVTAPATMTAGQTTTVSWTVQNQGAIP
ncbi:MAG: CARDB domain-containing protein, partial [Chthoniobacteraceae bacterium]